MRMGQNPIDHSYEEIRNAALESLRSNSGAISQYANLSNATAEILAKSDGNQSQAYQGFGLQDSNLSIQDANLFLGIFWELFRSGIISLGANDSNREFPFYHVTPYGKNILNDRDPYIFTDVSDYKRMIEARLPQLNPVTLKYALEAVQTFRIGSLLASSVMIGVAAEHTFNLLVETVEKNPAYSTLFRPVINERQILTRVRKFKDTLDNQQSTLQLPGEVKEDLDTRFSGIGSLIREIRNEAGHPTGSVIAREQVYINLQLFIPYAGKLYQLMEHFKVPATV